MAVSQSWDDYWGKYDELACEEQEKYFRILGDDFERWLAEKSAKVQVEILSKAPLDKLVALAPCIRRDTAEKFKRKLEDSEWTTFCNHWNDARKKGVHRV